MIVKLLTEHHLEFQSLKVGFTGSYESRLSKCQIVGNYMPRLKSKSVKHKIYNSLTCVLDNVLIRIGQLYN